jgi:predicted GNAT superfamily acetyltransferase
MEIQIKEGTINQAVELSKQIPEFENPNEDEYICRFKGKDPLILIAYVNNKPAGFKVGYKENDYFYSWMGGVLPEHRRKGIANRLSKNQEDWIIKMEIKKIRFKTQNKFKGMLIFALKNGFSILGTVPFEGVEGFKILLEKKLL